MEVSSKGDENTENVSLLICKGKDTYEEIRAK
jgi:hypothetical protein